MTEQRSRSAVSQKTVPQPVVNVIENAVKFSDQGSVAISCHGDSSGHRVVIRDTGIGMTPQQIEVALKPFGRAHDTALASRRQGTGLGLTYSREMMCLHGGTLSVESEVGTGTVGRDPFLPDGYARLARPTMGLRLADQ